MHEDVGCFGNGLTAKKRLPKQSRLVREDAYTNEGGSVKEASPCSKHRGTPGTMASKQTTNATTIQQKKSRSCSTRALSLHKHTHTHTHARTSFNKLFCRRPGENRGRGRALTISLSRHFVSHLVPQDRILVCHMVCSTCGLRDVC